MLVGCCSTSVVNGCCRVVESAEVMLVGCGNGCCGNGCCGNGCCSTSVVNGCCRVVESAGEVVLVGCCSTSVVNGCCRVVESAEVVLVKLVPLAPTPELFLLFPTKLPSVILPF